LNDETGDECVIFLLPMAAVLLGVAVGLALWGGRAWLGRKFARDVAWMRETCLRFSPETVNARAYMVIYYVGFALLLGALLVMLPNVVVAVGFWALALYLPRPLIEMAWRARIKKIDGQISQSVASLSNSMRAGLTLVQGITRLSEQAPEPIRVEFQIMANQYAYGADMETVLRNTKTRLGLPNFNLFASALLLNREMGGDVSDTLTRISKSLDRLREMRRTVEAHTSEGRTNIKVLLVAPVFMLLLIALVDGKDVMLLFTTTPGVAILTIALTLAGLGAYLANRITKSEV
jgi:tight adherence protein B